MAIPGHLPLSMSLATTWVAPLSFDAMAEAPQPLPTSRTVFPIHSSGLSKRYLQADVIRPEYRIPLQKCQLKIIPWQCLSPWPVYGPIWVMKRPKFGSFSPKSAIWCQQSQFDLGCQAVLPTYLRVVRYTFSDWVTGLKDCPFKSFKKYFWTLSVFLRRKSSEHNFKFSLHSFSAHLLFMCRTL